MSLCNKRIFFINSIFFLGLSLIAQESKIKKESLKKESSQSLTQKNNGFKILKIERGSVFEQLGLKERDIIEIVNNKKMNSTTDAMELYNALKTETKIDLVIERKGKKETIHYSVK